MCAWLQGFSNPSVFDPDRFSPERKEDIKYQKNFLTFGHGPHYCVGKDYAVNQIICYLANLSTRSAVLWLCVCGTGVWLYAMSCVLASHLDACTIQSGRVADPLCLLYLATMPLPSPSVVSCQALTMQGNVQGNIKGVQHQ